MIEFYIVKKTNTDKNVLRPDEKISLVEYQAAVDSNSRFTWFENTTHGQNILEEHTFTKKRRAYFEYNFNDPSGYVQLLWSKRGYIQFVVEGQKINRIKLSELIEFAASLKSDAWQLIPLKKLESLGEEE